MKHAPEAGQPVPFSGVGPGVVPQVTSRGYYREGVVHATSEAFETGGRHGSVVVTTLCGRRVVPMSVYGPESWPRLVEKWQRIGKTHETFTCGRCVTKHVRSAA